MDFGCIIPGPYIDCIWKHLLQLLSQMRKAEILQECKGKELTLSRRWGQSAFYFAVRAKPIRGIFSAIYAKASEFLDWRNTKN